LDALLDDTCGGTVVPNITGRSLAKSDHDDMIREVEFPSSSAVDGPQSTQLWNAMIHPLRHMRLAGALWYQGEANAGDPPSYACRFPAMIADWRIKFQLPNLPFLYVELAGYQPGDTWPWLRAAQASALTLPGVGQATAIDLCDLPGEIHPHRKQEVGRRLSMTMRAIHYEDETVIEDSSYLGPVWDGIQFARYHNDDDTNTTMTIITLSLEDGTAHGLYFGGSAMCSQCCNEPPFQILDASGNWNRVDGMSIKSKDRFLRRGVWHPQEMEVGSSSSSSSTLPRVDVIVHGNLTIYGLRYAWEPRPECFLYNGGKVPAEPLEWCAYPTGQPHWTNHSCGGLDDVHPESLPPPTTTTTAFAVTTKTQ